jgi:fermentation-respiration switch protein FrsA (DUF1100 family)
MALKDIAEEGAAVGVAAAAAVGPRTRRAVRRFMISVVAGVVALLLLVYVGVSAYSATTAIRASRFPVEGTPADVGLAYEPVAFESAEDRLPLRGWFLPASSDRAIVLIHGLDSNRWRHDSAAGLTKLYLDAGYNVLLFDLRAQGESGGDRLGLGWYERRDVAGAVAVLRARGFAPGKIGLHGGSYGAATALLATAAIPEVGAVVADSAFADSRDLFDAEIKGRTGLPPVFTPGISAFVGAFYGLDLATIPPLRAVPLIAPRPILFIHGGADTRIPIDHSRRLRAASRNPTDGLWEIPEAGHARGFSVRPAEFTARVTTFFDSALK